MELVRGKTTYKWYGTFMRDWPLPKGFTPQDLGRCEHAARVIGKPGAYELGLVRRRDGQEGYTLLFDFWAGGHGLVKQVGVGPQDCDRLLSEYHATVAMRTAARLGHTCEIERDAAGVATTVNLYT